MSNTVHSKPETASKPSSSKRPGRQSNKIAQAFSHLTSTPVSVSSFAEKHGVSVAVLRQAKRFDRTPELGKVRVKHSKETNELMIWRESTQGE